MTKMQESDPKLEILPWYSNDIGEEPIKNFKSIPTSLFLFKKYFQRANPKENGGKIYTDVYISHSKPIEELTGDLSWWLKKEDIDIYIKDIQAETTVRLGWLLFSFGSLHVGSLTSEISALAKVQVAGRFKAILTDTWDPHMDSKKRLKAIHLECDKKDERKARKYLLSVYGSTSTSFPLGIRMRLVAEYRDIKGNPNNLKKVANLRAKQAHFLQAIETEYSDEILNLDVMHSKYRMTLRQMIMDIKTWGE